MLVVQSQDNQRIATADAKLWAARRSPAPGGLLGRSRQRSARTVAEDGCVLQPPYIRRGSGHGALVLPDTVPAPRVAVVFGGLYGLLMKLRFPA